MVLSHIGMLGFSGDFDSASPLDAHSPYPTRSCQTIVLLPGSPIYRLLPLYTHAI